MSKTDICKKDKQDTRKFELFYPLLITLIFFIIIFYISFMHYQYVFNSDGLFYLNAGKQILTGDGKNVSVPNAPIGGPIIYAMFDNVINDVFLTLKLFSILCGTGIVFVSYYIIRNFSYFKIAILGQIFFAISPALQTRAVLATNELLALLFIFCGVFFFTKENIQRRNLVFAAVFLGIASDIRYQAILVFIPFLIFLMVSSNGFKKNIKNIALFSIVYLACLLPVFTYNLSTHGTILESDYTFYTMLDPRFEDTKSSSIEGVQNYEFQKIFSNEEISFKNYLDNLFFYNSNLLFNFFGNNAISLIPLVPYLAIIPIFGGFIGIIYEKINRKLILQSLILSLIILFLILLFGELKTHFFSIIVMPVIFLGVMTIKQIQKNLIPIIILAPIYFILISIVPLDRADHLFSIWITISILCSIFFLNTIPKILTQFIKKPKFIKMITLTLIFFVILSNVGFSYKLFEITLYGTINEGIQIEVEKIFQEKHNYPQMGYEMKQISDILKTEPDIKKSYIMSNNHAYSYYTNAKNVYATFKEGVKGDSIIKYVTRENWSPFDLYFSNINSIPSDKYNNYKPLPNYLVYTPIKEETINEKIKNKTMVLDLKVLSDPKNVKTPTNFEVIFKSNETGTVVYKINWED